MTHRSFYLILANLIVVVLLIAFSLWYIHDGTAFDFYISYVVVICIAATNLLAGLILFFTRHKDLALGFLLSLLVVGLSYYGFFVLMVYV